MTDLDIAVADEPLLAPFEYPGVAYSDDGLVLPDDLPFDMWYAMGGTLYRMERSVQWALADWLNFGEEHYPDRYTQALDATHYQEKQSLYNIAWVGRQFPRPDDTQSNPGIISPRNTDVPFTHHRMIGGLPVEQRNELLARTERESLTKEQVVAEVVERKKINRTGTPTWLVIADASGDDWMEAQTTEGHSYGASVAVDGVVYLNDAAGHSFVVKDLDDLQKKLYALKAEAKRHFGEWPQK